MELLLEAERRGILPADKKGLLDEARRRGLVAQAGASAETTPSGIDPRAAAPAQAFGHGALEGVPVVGPALSAFAERGRAMTEGVTAEESAARTAEVTKAHPGTHLAGQITGGVASMAPFGAGAVGRALFGTIPRGAATGAGVGAADVAVRGGDPLTGAAVGAAGGAVGPAVGKALGGIGARLSGKAAEAPSLQVLKNQADALYTAADNSGVVLSEKAFSRMAFDLAQTAQKAGLNADLQPRAAALVAAIRNMQGRNPTLRDLDTLRKQIGDVAGNIDRGEARLGSILIDRLDEMVANLGSRDVLAGDPRAAVATLKEARGLWRRVRNLEHMEDAFERALNAAEPTGQALRSQARRLINNKKIARGFNKSEMDALKAVARGETLDAILQEFGRARLLVMGTIGSVAGSVVGGPVGAVGGAAAGAGLFAAGRGAQAAVSRGRFDAARSAIATGQPPPVNPAAEALGRTMILGSGLPAAR